MTLFYLYTHTLRETSDKDKLTDWIWSFVLRYITYIVFFVKYELKSVYIIIELNYDQMSSQDSEIKTTGCSKEPT